MPKPLSILLWLGAGFAAYCFIWMGTTQTQAEHIIANVEEFSQQHPTLAIDYDDVSFDGFPFSNIPVLQNVRIGYGEYTLSLGDVAFASRDEGQGRFLIAPKQATIHATMAQKKSFAVKVSEYPLLSVRAGENLAESDPRIFKEFAVGLPRNITLDVVSETDATRSIGFTLQPVAVPVWRSIPNQPERTLELFVLMLDEAFMRPQ